LLSGYKLPTTFEFVKVDHFTPSQKRIMQSTETIQAVQDYYGGLAERGSADRSEDYQTSVAKAFGYDPDDLKSLPENANLGVSCGNPLALASLREVCMAVQSPARV
jgi:hypothetical protein